MPRAGTTAMQTDWRGLEVSLQLAGRPAPQGLAIGLREIAGRAFFQNVVLVPGNGFVSSSIPFFGPVVFESSVQSTQTRKFASASINTAFTFCS